MKRWFYILIGALGVSLFMGAVAAYLWYQPLGQSNITRTAILEIAGVVLGAILAVIGFINGRNAGELDISSYMRTPRKDYGVNGGEISFACPVCKKGYRASPLLIGKPFTCRDCKKSFKVSPLAQLPDTAERRLMRAAG